MSNIEQQIEQEIQDKGLNAPRLTPEHIDATISSVNYFTADDGVVGRSHQNKEVLFNPGVLSTLTFCVIVLKNGFTVTGESACASPENFDPEIGRKIAYQNAREKIWQLEGYLLKERLYQQHQVIDGELPVPTVVNCGESSGSVGNAQSCSGNVSCGNHRTIKLLLEILRGANVGGDVTDKARAKLSELVDNI